MALITTASGREASTSLRARAKQSIFSGPIERTASGEKAQQKQRFFEKKRARAAGQKTFITPGL
jgi:hypothetical protein